MVQVDLITGFLGAGKTTFLRRYAAWWAGQGVKVCVLENDFGAVNVDAMLLQDLEARGVELETISGGCDCDTLQRRMRTKLIAMAMRGFDRVVVEPSGIFDVDEFFDILRDDPLDRWYQLGSIEYAAGHLGCRLVVVLGHTHCGAVDAAINSEPSGYIRCITDEIKKAIGDETDPYKASCLNVRHSVQEIEKSLCIHNIEEETGLRVVGAMYHIEDGSVEFL